ncbi:uncharacterized protein O3C94_007094 [Discoglossus pictus]
MANLTQGHEVEALRNENVRLMGENVELRKMVALMQENVELRYALREHESNVQSLSPPSPTKDKANNKSCPKESFVHTSAYQPGSSAGQNVERHGLNSVGVQGGSHSGKSSSHPKQQLSGHRKLIESLTKLHVQEKAMKESNNHSMMANY